MPLLAHDWLQSLVPAHAPGAEAWWQAVARMGTPLCRTRVGHALQDLLFLWRQPPGGAVPQAVYIDVDGHTPHPSEGAARLQLLPGTDLWFWQTELPADWLGSYAFLPVDPAWPAMPTAARERRAWWMAAMQAFGQADPWSLYPAAADGWGRPRAVLRPDGDSASMASVPAGSSRQWTWHSARLGAGRSVWLHQTAPASATEAIDDATRPWVLLLDGQAWAGPLQLFPLLDGMTADGQLPAANYLAIDARDPESRWQDMGCDARFWQALHEELLPEALQAAGLGGPGCLPQCLVAGQSLGGLAAAYAALHWPERYPALLSQSGSFWWPDLAQGPDHARLVQQVKQGLGRGHALQALFQYGERDPQDMQAVSRQMAEAVRANTGNPKGVRAWQVAGGHDWVCWREALLAGLSELLPTLQERCIASVQ